MKLSLCCCLVGSATLQAVVIFAAHGSLRALHSAFLENASCTVYIWARIWFIVTRFFI